MVSETHRGLQERESERLHPVLEVRAGSVRSDPPLQTAPHVSSREYVHVVVFTPQGLRKLLLIFRCHYLGFYLAITAMLVVMFAPSDSLLVVCTEIYFCLSSLSVITVNVFYGFK